MRTGSREHATLRGGESIAGRVRVARSGTPTPLCWLVALAVTLAAGLAALGASPARALAGEAPGQDAAATSDVVIRGRVIDAASRLGISGASVVLFSAGDKTRRQIVTDSGGQFVARGLARGTYRISASHKDYQAGGYGQMWATGPFRPLYVSAHDPYDVTIRLWTNGSISGRVTTVEGTGVSGATVHAIPQTRGAIVRPAQRLTTVTAADGGYRLTLPPGRYIVGTVQSYRTVCDRQSGCRVLARERSLSTVALKSGEVRTYQSAFSGNAQEALDASTVVVTGGETRTNVDMVVELASGVRLSGVVHAPSGPATNVLVSATRRGNLGLGPAITLGDYLAGTDENGRFTMVGVHEGTYILRSEYRPTVTQTTVKDGVITGRVGGPSPSDVNPVLEASLPLTVGRLDIPEYDLVLSPAPFVRGTLEFDGAQSERPTADQLASARVVLAPESVGPPMMIASVDVRAGFSFPSVAAARYRVAVEGLGRWTLDAVDVPGRGPAVGGVIDLGTDYGGLLVLRLIHEPARIAGRVAAASGAPEPNATVFLFPADTSVAINAGQIIPVSASGQFTSAPLRAGEYMLAALADGWFDSEWQEPDALSQLRRRATTVRVGEHQTATVTLRASSVP